MQPLGMAVDDTSLYVTTSERSDDGLGGLRRPIGTPRSALKQSPKTARREPET